MFETFKADGREMAQWETESEFWGTEAEQSQGEQWQGEQWEGEQWEGEDEVRRRRGGASRWPRPVSNRARAARPAKASLSRPSRRPGPRPGRRPPPRYIRRTRLYDPVVYEPVTYSNENVRWVQDCLNRKQGLSLPIDGFAGPETRSAIRSFQQQQGLPANGFLDPETLNALRGFCRASSMPQPAPAPDAEPTASDDGADSGAAPSDSGADGDGDEGEIGHTQMSERNISLTWFSKNGQGGDRFLYTLQEAMKAVSPNQGGVYIMIGDALPGSKKPAGVCASCTRDCVLKVGIAEEFRSRFAVYLKPGNTWPNGCSWGNLRVYIAAIGGFYNLDRYVERALDRLLRKQGYALPGGRPVPAQRVNSKVVIHNVLPTSSALLANVRAKVAQNRLPLERGTHYEFVGASTKPCSCKSVKSCSCQLGSGCSCKSRSVCSCKAGGNRAYKSGGACSCKTRSPGQCSCKNGGSSSCRNCSSTCRNCGSAPCRCGSSASKPACSCGGRCKQANKGITNGQWLRRGNKLQVMGVQP